MNRLVVGRSAWTRWGLSTVWATVLALSSGVSIGLWPGSARAEDVVEPGSEQHFSTQQMVAGKPYTLIGVGLRKKFIVKVYAMGLYVEQAAARQAFPSLIAKSGGADRGKLLAGDRTQKFVSWGHFGKLGVMHFLRTVDKDKIQEAYQDSLSSELSDKAPPELSRDARAFVNLFDREVKEGQEIRILTEENGKISVEIAGQKKDGPQNAVLCRAIWEIWLGSKTISKDMQHGLVERIDELGK